MSAPKETPLVSGSVGSHTSPIQSPLQDENVIKKCRELLTIEGYSNPSVKSMVEQFDNLFFGFIIGQRRSSLASNVTLLPSRRVRPTPVGKPQSELPIKDIQTPVERIVLSPAKMAGGETRETSKLVLLTSSMAESLNKSVLNKDGRLASPITPFNLDSSEKDAAEEAGTEMSDSRSKLIPDQIAKSDSENTSVHQDGKNRAKDSAGSPVDPKKLPATATVMTTSSDRSSTSAEDLKGKN